MPTLLRLEVIEYTDRTRWHWILMDENGTFLAAHEIRLDRSAEQFGAFTDLQDYITLHAAPDNRLTEEARIVTWLGDWIGAEVFGPAIGNVLLQHAPAIVEVALPAGAETLAYRPLEVARCQGRSLAGHDITLVILPAAASDAVPKTSKTDCLRVLGLFSLPEGGTALNQRRERQSLITLINDISGSGRSAEVKVLQYGVTQARLREILNDGEGWDIIHISGHGVPGELVLETADGRPDHIAAADLADLLAAARDRVKLVTVSACWSAALATAGTRRQLGLPAQEDPSQHPPERISGPPPSQPPAPGDIATTLATRLGCAVLAMRFPVGDEFAIELTKKQYDLLIREGLPLPRAVSLALSHLTDSGQAFRFPALSMAAPAVFGATATDLTLRAPERSHPAPRPTENLKTSGFGEPHERFVGRTHVMARASAVLAAESGIPGVILHGMPGGGKTACALELAYTHQDAFDKLIWFQAPDECSATDASLIDFALTLEDRLPGLKMFDKLVNEEALTAFLPQLTRLMERTRLLLVIDNAESLLTAAGEWRDKQWRKTFGALTGHNGLGRVIMTSRRVPARKPHVQVEVVDALSADETLLLTRELPHLEALTSGRLNELDESTAHNLALSVLNIARGHPKLLELANRQSTHPEQLAALIQSGGQAWQERGTLPDGFFTAEEASVPAEDYLHVLAAWTNAITDTLSPRERDLFWYLCCIEEDDRQHPVIYITWPVLWQELGRPGNPPELDQLLANLDSSGLVTICEESINQHEAYSIHPSIAAAGRNQAGCRVRDVADTVAALFWDITYNRAAGEAGDGTVDISLMIHAGLASVPYLIRRQRWKSASVMLHNAFIRDPSRANATRMLPAIQQITRHDPLQKERLATVLGILDPAAAEAQLHNFLSDASSRGDYLAAGNTAGELASLYRTSGRRTEAFSLIEQQVYYHQRADAGPGIAFIDEIRRLQILCSTGNAREVLEDVKRLRNYIDTSASDLNIAEGARPWHIREVLLDTGRSAASQLGMWDDALNFNAELTDSMYERSAPESAIARTWFNDYGPLLQLGRIDHALSVLRNCHQVFVDTHDIEMLGNTFSAIAHIEEIRDHGDAAIRLERNALRYQYGSGDVTGISISYHNLGIYLHLHTHRPASAFASQLAAALISTFTGTNDTDNSIRAAALALRAFGAATEPPVSVADLCRKLGDIPGTDPAVLIAKVAPDPETAEQTLQDLIAQAQVLVQEPE